MLLSYESSTEELECRLAVLDILIVTVNSLTAHCFVGGSTADGSPSILSTLMEKFCFDIDLLVSVHIVVDFGLVCW